MDELAADKKRWQKEIVDPVLGRFPERKESFETSSGIPIERAHLPDLPLAAACPQIADDYLDKLGFPGEHPFGFDILFLFHIFQLPNDRFSVQFL